MTDPLARPLALLTALEVEGSALARRLSRQAAAPRGITIHEGKLEGRPVLLVVGGVGKVAAAMATQYVCDTLHPSGFIGFGLAGAVASGADPGHVVVASGALQHDFDARPLTGAKGEIPGLGVSVLEADGRLSEALADAARRALEQPDRAATGLVLTGDQIVSAKEVRDALADAFPGASCIDMETAAMAQVARQNGLPWAALRVTSDSADETFDLDEVIGFGARTAAELFARIIAMAMEDLQ